MTPEYMTAKEAAEYLRSSPSTLAKRRLTGNSPPLRELAQQSAIANATWTRGWRRMFAVRPPTLAKSAQARHERALSSSRSAARPIPRVRCRRARDVAGSKQRLARHTHRSAMTAAALFRPLLSRLREGRPCYRCGPPGKRRVECRTLNGSTTLSENITGLLLST